MITTIAFDADDTLWHNEQAMFLTEARFRSLLREWLSEDELGPHLFAVQRRNLERYGYGVKSFVLSMIETAIEATDGRVPTRVIADIVAFGHELLAHPVEPLPGVAETLEALKSDYRLLVVTKGDLLNQEQKIARSGLGDYFDAVEIVSEKDETTYARLFDRHGDGADRALMVGNSVRSDILPALAAGAWAVHVPYAVTWAHEVAETPVDHPRFAAIERMDELPGWLTTANGRA